MNKILTFIIAALGISFRPAVPAPVRPEIRLKPVPVLVRVPNGFPIPARSNGASRRRKSNRLRISKLARNKHR